MITAPPAAAPEGWDAVVSDQRESLRLLASETGGITIVEMAELDAALQLVATEP